VVRVFLLTSLYSTPRQVNLGGWLNTKMTYTSLEPVPLLIRPNDVQQLCQPTCYHYAKPAPNVMKWSKHIQRADKDLSVDVFPLLTAANALLQRLNAGLYKASKDTVEIDLFAAATNYLIAQLYATNTQTVTQFVIQNAWMDSITLLYTIRHMHRPI